MAKPEMTSLYLFLFIQLLTLSCASNADNELTKKYNACLCHDYSPNISDRQHNTLRQDASVEEHSELHCCAKKYIGDAHRNFSVTWTGIRTITNSTTFEVKDGCFQQILFSKLVRKYDSGNYSCLISAENGTIFTKTIKLIVGGVYENVLPRVCNATSEPIYNARVGQTLKLNCTFCLDDISDDFYVSWTKTLNNGSTILLKGLHGMNQKKTIFVKDRYVSEVILKNISELHFGGYTCFGKTRAYSVPHNLTVTKDVDPHTKEERFWTKVCVSSVISFILLLLLLFVGYQNRYMIAFKCKSLKHIVKGLAKAAVQQCPSVDHLNVKPSARNCNYFSTGRSQI